MLILGGDDTEIDEDDPAAADDGWSLDHEISGSMEEIHGKLLVLSCHVLFDSLRDVSFPK